MAGTLGTSNTSQRYGTSQEFRAGRTRRQKSIATGRVAAQGLISHYYWTVDGRFESFAMPFRYVWPSELDLMARIAGLTPRDRWADWDRSPFTAESRKHVSIWQKTT